MSSSSILSSELILLAPIASIGRHGNRMDVLSGRYFTKPPDRTASPVRNIQRQQRWGESAREANRKRRARAPIGGEAEPVASLARDEAGEARARSREPIAIATHAMGNSQRLMTGWG